MTLTLLPGGTLEPADDLAGWIITSVTAMARGAEDLRLRRGDYVAIDGRVVRDGHVIARL